MGSILNFVFPFNQNYSDDIILNGPLTNEVIELYSHTFNNELKENHLNYLLIETKEKYKGAIRLIESDFVFDKNLPIIFASIADPSTIYEKKELVSRLSTLGFDMDKVFFIDSNFQHKNDYNTFTWHFFLEEFSKNIDHVYRNEKNDLGYKCNAINENELNSFRNKKFLSFNRSMDKHHRISLLSDFLSNDFSDSYFSFLNLHSNYSKIYNESGLKDFDLNTYSDILPIEIDTNGNHEDFRTENTIKKELFLDSCISIVTETTFNDNELFLSEKIVKPIISFHPFIMIGPYGSLRELRNLGFKTFSEFWDESYDEIENPNDRYVAIKEVILELNHKSINELNDLYQKTKNICIYNRKNFLNIENTFNKFIKTL